MGDKWQMDEVEEEYMKVAKQYLKTFGDIYPVKCRGITMEYAIQDMKKCLKEGKPFEYNVPAGAKI